MTAPAWVKLVGALLAVFGVAVALPLAVTGAALADGVTTDRTTSQTIEVAVGAPVSLNAVSADLTVLAGPDGQVRVDEHDIVRALTRRLAGAALDRLHTTLEQTSTGVRISPADESFNTFAGFSRRQITVHVPSGSNLHVTSVSGDLRVSGIHGDVSVDTESGSVVLEGMDVTGLASAHVVSGDLEFRGAIHGGKVDLRTVSGSVHAYVPSDTNVHFDASTISGGVFIDRGFGLPLPVLGNGPGRSTSGDLGTGAPATLVMNAVSGDIFLRLT